MSTLMISTRFYIFYMLERAKSNTASVKGNEKNYSGGSSTIYDTII